MQQRKLSRRLQKIADVCQQLIETQTIDHVVDLCCDHGYLGFSLLASNPALQLSFVDVLPHLQAELINKLQQLNLYDAEQTQVHTLDACQLDLIADLSIPAASIADNQTVLLVIAGVGGDACAEMIKQLIKNHQQYPSLNLRLLVSPSNNVFRLRQALQCLNVGLLSEHFIDDRGRGYECLLLAVINNQDKNLSNNTMMSISDVGDLWDVNNLEQYHYLQSLLAHYKRQEFSFNNEEVEGDVLNQVLSAVLKYSELLETFEVT